MLLLFLLFHLYCHTLVLVFLSALALFLFLTFVIFHLLHCFSFSCYSMIFSPLFLFIIHLAQAWHSHTHIKFSLLNAFLILDALLHFPFCYIIGMGSYYIFNVGCCTCTAIYTLLSFWFHVYCIYYCILCIQCYFIHILFLLLLINSCIVNRGNVYILVFRLPASHC